MAFDYSSTSLFVPMTNISFSGLIIGKEKDILIYYPQMALAGGLGKGKVGDLDSITCRQ